MASTISWNANTVKELFEDFRLLEHFLSEPALPVPPKDGRPASFIVRKANSPNVISCRAGLVVRLRLFKHDVVWAEGEDCFVARARDPQTGSWTRVLFASSANELLNSEIKAVLRPNVKTRFSAKNYLLQQETLPKKKLPTEGASCFLCGAIDQQPWRFGSRSERLCNRCWQRERRRVQADSSSDSEDSSDGEGSSDDFFVVSVGLLSKLSNLLSCKACGAETELSAAKDRRVVLLRCLGQCGLRSIPSGVKTSTISASIISSGATYSSAKNMLQRSGIQFPISESAFYDFQKNKYLPWIARERNNHLDTFLEEQRGNAIKISVDARWGTKRNALEGTVTCFLHPADGSRKEIIEVQHIGGNCDVYFICSFFSMSLSVLRSARSNWYHREYCRKAG